jgi:formylglycine-generating enzyme required for sulfatase activity/tetratricopeptide (TPR) repeat protein
MWREPWNIFHFIGHGRFDERSDEGYITLVNEEGRAAELRAAELVRLLADYPSLRLVLLNSCEGARSGGRSIFSSTAATLVRRGIPAVLAMQYEISDRAATEFARVFYRALAYGMSVDEAVVEARQAICLAVTNTVEWGTPVLYSRCDDGVLFEMTKTPQRVTSLPKDVKPLPAVDVEQEQRLERLYLDGLDAYWVEEWDQAQRSFQAIVDQKPDYQDAAARLREVKRQRLYAQAQTALKDKDWSGALSTLEKLVDEAPEFRDAANLLETTRKQAQLAGLYAEAQQLHRAGRWQAVVSIFAQIAALEPDYRDPKGLLAAAQREIEAEECQMEVHDLYRRAGLAVNSGQWPEARELLCQVQDQEPGYRETERLLARAEAEIEREKRVPSSDPRFAEPKVAVQAQAEIDGEGALLRERIWPKWRLSWQVLLAIGSLALIAIIVITGAIVWPIITATPMPTITPEPDETVVSVVSPNPPAGATRVWEKDDSVMVYVPAGSFMMGNTAEDIDAFLAECIACEPPFGDEKPRHEVILDAFWIDRTEVTNGQYRRCVEAGECSPPSPPHEDCDPEDCPSHWFLESHGPDSYYGSPDFDDYPVVYVNWDQARAYCAWAGKRLPTEAEWEKAARGTEERVYPWGNTFDGTIVNFCDVNCTFDWKADEWNDNYADTALVGSYGGGVSPYGALDMAGNVIEWTSSRYQSYPYQADDGREDLENSGEVLRVLRGGSWFGTKWHARAAIRHRTGHIRPDAHVGFRCACSDSEP